MMSKRSRELNLSRAGRGVWLLKVPKYLSEAWKSSDPGVDLGVISISQMTIGNMKVSFSLADELRSSQQKKTGAVGHSSQAPTLPVEHRMVVAPQAGMRQSLCVFSEDESGELCAEGRVTQRADIQPVSSSCYMKLKRYQIREASKTKFTVQSLKKTPVTSYKPVADHRENIIHQQHRKEAGKRARADRETVLDLLFTAFQQHQYYNFKDLVHKTQQPHVYLKELLKEIAVYSKKMPHKNMWELKPEYRNYKPSPDKTLS